MSSSSPPKSNQSASIAATMDRQATDDKESGSRSIGGRLDRWPGVVDRCDVTRRRDRFALQEAEGTVRDHVSASVQVAADRFFIGIATTKMHGEMTVYLLEVLGESLADDALVEPWRLAQEVEGIAVQQLLPAVRTGDAVAARKDHLRIEMVKAALEVPAIGNLAQQVGTAEHLAECDGRAFIPCE